MNDLQGGCRLRPSSITRRNIFEIVVTESFSNVEKQKQLMRDYVLQITGDGQLSVETTNKLKHLLSDFKSRWQACRRNSKHFYKNNEGWLAQRVEVAVKSEDCDGVGRPKVDFASSSERSKRRKTEHLRATASSEQLAYAAQMKLRSEGATNEASIIKNAICSKYENLNVETPSHPYPSFSSEQALSVIVEAKLTKFQYCFLRSSARQIGNSLYPPYHHVLKSKNLCYPENITVSETIAEVCLQNLLDHTAERILRVQEVVLKCLTKVQLENLKLICKWGCDGTSGQSEYKQKFEDARNSDASIVQTSLVPLQIVTIQDDSLNAAQVIVWQNPRPSSTRYCRPIRLQFKSETTELIIKEKEYIDSQINDLKPLSSIVDGREAIIKYDMIFSMIDGKVCNAVSAVASAQRCYICKATSKDFNDIDKVRKLPTDNSLLKFGISPLHAWIRLFETLLHLSYKLETQKWQARSKEEKARVEEKKKTVQALFKSELGLIVDKPKQNYGSSNDGNTARRFFSNSDKASAITGIEKTLIDRFHTILSTLSSGFNVNVSKFQDFALETARIFVAKYPWYPMPTTVHKILIHGSDIIENAALPIGQLSEECLEARNKDIKKYREGYSRKMSRTKTLEDVFLRLLLSSDPLISSLRKVPKRDMKSLSPSVLELLVEPELSVMHQIEPNSDDSESDV